MLTKYSIFSHLAYVEYHIVINGLIKYICNEIKYDKSIANAFKGSMNDKINN